MACSSFIAFSMLIPLVVCNLCPIQLKGKCQCVPPLYEEGIGKQSTNQLPRLTSRLPQLDGKTAQNGIRVECTDTESSNFHQDINSIFTYFNGSKTIHALQVRDSNLNQVRGLPSGLQDVRHLTLDHTGIDLEQVRESNELLANLKSLRVYNENFTEIPESFFYGFHELTILELNEIGVAAISEDGFMYLEDSLKELRLRENKLRSIPVSIASLSRLETLDLENNDISSVSDGLADLLERGLKSLNRLIMNRELLVVNHLLSHATLTARN